MDKGENETIICYNYGDIEELGGFYFWTSVKQDWVRLCKRVGEEKLRNVIKGKRHWQCLVPAELWQKMALGIRKVQRERKPRKHKCAT